MKMEWCLLEMLISFKPTSRDFCKNNSFHRELKNFVFLSFFVNESEVFRASADSWFYKFRLSGQISALQRHLRSLVWWNPLSFNCSNIALIFIWTLFQHCIDFHLNTTLFGFSPGEQEITKWVCGSCYFDYNLSSPTFFLTFSLKIAYIRMWVDAFLSQTLIAAIINK